ncbi:MAG: DUF3187 family protein [Granulosicoccus sp.]|nr:DUF3187 family protein [Granulosicoccus sp.]
MTWLPERGTLIQSTHRIAFLGLCLCTTSPVDAEQGDDAAMLQLRSQHALGAVFGLPGVAQRPVQSYEWQLSLEHSNQFMGGTAGEETLFLDGETTELTFHYRQRLAPCWQGDLALPFIQHGAGLFDRAIDDWHQFFGMPDAGRDAFAFGEFTYSYRDEDGNGVTIDQPQSGFGNIRLSVQRSLECQATADSNASESIARLGLKLPTGSLSEFRGSGSPDLYADIQSPVWSSGARWRAGATVGVMLTGRGSRLPPQRALVGFGTVGVQYRLTHRYRLIAQVDWHTPFFHSRLRELGDATFVLSTGLRYLARHDQTLELSISEDAAIDTAPDIVARLAWIYRPTPGQ